jgi:hypothetical protein
MEKWGQIEALVAPMDEIAAGWAVTDAMPVHEQNKAVIGAHTDHVAARHRTQSESVAEVEDDGIAQGGSGMGDPSGLPFVVRRIDRRRDRLGGRESVRNQRDKGDKRESISLSENSGFSSQNGVFRSKTARKNDDFGAF